MFASYQIQGSDFPDRYLRSGQEVENANAQLVRKALSSFVSPKGEIDAAQMMQEWFSAGAAQVFLSHSRADKALALKMAGWLKEELNLTAFVDSCMWGHANDLLRQIDSEYGDLAGTHIDYERSRATASHVHLMLSTALTQMIDRCECVFFLKSDHSLKPLSVQQMAQSQGEPQAQTQTQSPWLFHELSMLQLIRRRDAAEHRRVRVRKSADFDMLESTKELPKFNYPVNLKDMPELTQGHLDAWAARWAKDRHTPDSCALDSLYEVMSPENISMRFVLRNGRLTRLDS